MSGALALVAAGWLAGWLLGRPLRRLPDAAVAPGTAVSVVVPARDEAATLPGLLDRLRGHDVTVVDDGSSDATAEVASAGGARVVTVGGGPPPGWTGKAWACSEGARATSGDVLVFLDADCEPGHGFVAALAGAAQRSGGLVSVQPWHRVVRPYEHLSAVANLVAVLGAGTGPAPPAARRWWRRPAAFGPAMAIPRPAYERMGGHAAVAGAVTDDLAFAAAADAAGVPVAAYGRADVAYRMYPAGAGALVEGWSKNLATGAASLPPVRLALTILWVAACVQAALLPLTVAYPAMAVQLLVLWRPVGRFGPVTALLFPVPLAAFVALFARSLWFTRVRGAVRWRGRSLVVR